MRLFDCDELINLQDCIIRQLCFVSVWTVSIKLICHQPVPVFIYTALDIPGSYVYNFHKYLYKINLKIGAAINVYRHWCPICYEEFLSNSHSDVPKKDRLKSRKEKLWKYYCAIKIYWAVYFHVLPNQSSCTTFFLDNSVCCLQRFPASTCNGSRDKPGRTHHREFTRSWGH